MYDSVCSLTMMMTKNFHGPKLINYYPRDSDEN